MKYYVQSGELKLIISGNHPFEAVRSAIEKKKNEYYLYNADEGPMQLSLAPVILISEKGFADIIPNQPFQPRRGEVLLNTNKVMQALGWASGRHTNDGNSDDS